MNPTAIRLKILIIFNVTENEKSLEGFIENDRIGRSFLQEHAGSTRAKQDCLSRLQNGSSAPTVR